MLTTFNVYALMFADVLESILSQLNNFRQSIKAFCCSGFKAARLAFVAKLLTSAYTLGTHSFGSESLSQC